MGVPAPAGAGDRTITVRGTYTDAEGHSVSDTLQVQIRLLVAPRFYNAGSGQPQAISQLGQFSSFVKSQLAQNKVPEAVKSRILADLDVIEQGVRQWWPKKLAPPLGHLASVILSSILPANPDLGQALLHRVSDLKDAFAQAGLLFPDAFSITPAFLAPWGEYRPFVPLCPNFPQPPYIVPIFWGGF